MTAASRPSVLLDTNIVLDVLLERPAFLADAQAIWEKCDSGEIDAWVSAVTLSTVFYVGRKQLGREKALEGVRTCLESFQVAPVDHDVVAAALTSGGSDFEDSVQIACAQRLHLARIVTRDSDGFRTSPIPALTPSAFLAELARHPE